MEMEVKMSTPNHRVLARGLAGHRPKGKEPLRVCMIIQNLQELKKGT